MPHPVPGDTETPALAARRAGGPTIPQSLGPGIPSLRGGSKGRRWALPCPFTERVCRVFKAAPQKMCPCPNPRKRECDLIWKGGLWRWNLSESPNQSFWIVPVGPKPMTSVLTRDRKHVKTEAHMEGCGHKPGGHLEPPPPGLGEAAGPSPDRGPVLQEGAGRRHRHAGRPPPADPPPRRRSCGSGAPPADSGSGSPGPRASASPSPAAFWPPRDRPPPGTQDRS